MNAISLFTQDHRNVKELFRDFESAGDHAARRKEEIAKQVFSELEVHSTGTVAVTRERDTRSGAQT